MGEHTPYVSETLGADIGEQIARRLAKWGWPVEWVTFNKRQRLGFIAGYIKTTAPRQEWLYFEQEKWPKLTHPIRFNLFCDGIDAMVIEIGKDGTVKQVEG